MITYLYVKTHTITGLKYLGQTSNKDPHKYTGSGKYWQRHLKVHGSTYTTEILKECEHPAMLQFWGQHYSDLWNIVESDKWANLKPETGDGSKGFKMTDEQRQKIKDGLKGRVLSEEHKSKLSALKKGQSGHLRSAETRAKMSASQKGKTKPPGYWDTWRAARQAKRQANLSIP